MDTSSCTSSRQSCRTLGIAMQEARILQRLQENHSFPLRYHNLNRLLLLQGHKFQEDATLDLSGLRLSSLSFKVLNVFKMLRHIDLSNNFYTKIPAVLLDLRNCSFNLAGNPLDTKALAKRVRICIKHKCRFLGRYDDDIQEIIKAARDKALANNALK